MSGQLQAAENGLAVPHEFELRLLRRRHLQDDVVFVDRPRVGGDARTGLAVVGVRELGVDPGTRLHDDLMAMGDQQSDGIGVERHAPFLQHHLLGDADAQAVLMGANGQLLFLRRQCGLEGESPDAFLGFHGRIGSGRRGI